LVVLLGLSAPGGAVAQPRQATVLSVGDGDTIRVRQNGTTITVRLACIDAPELAQRPHGQRARDYLRQRLPSGAPVRLLVKTTDRYGRLVAEVIGEINLGLALVEDGQAFVYRRYLHQCDAQKYLAAESRASRRRHGAWQVPGGITRPWEFQRLRRSSRSADGSPQPAADGHISAQL
jgi:endonuclease YncB( thermonuclease family)